MPDAGRTGVDTRELTATAAQFAAVAETVAEGSRLLRSSPAPGAFGSGADGVDGRRRYEAARASLTQAVEALRGALGQHGDALRRHAADCERTEDDNAAAARRMGSEPGFSS